MNSMTGKMMFQFRGLSRSDGMGPTGFALGPGHPPINKSLTFGRYARMYIREFTA